MPVAVLFIVSAASMIIFSYMTKAPEDATLARFFPHKLESI